MRVTSPICIGLLTWAAVLFDVPKSFAQGTVPPTPRVNVTNIEAAGNLAESVPFNGTKLSEIRPEHTPPDLARRASALFLTDREAALKLATAAQVLAFFDMSRVADETAHEAWPALVEKHRLGTLMSWGMYHPDAYQNAIRETSEWAASIPAPSYFPAWMIQHGMGAFAGAQKGQELVPGFGGAENWKSQAIKLAAFGTDETIWAKARSALLPAGAKETVDQLIERAKVSLPASSELEKGRHAKDLAEFGQRLDVSKGETGEQLFEISEAINQYARDQLQTLITKTTPELSGANPFADNFVSFPVPAGATVQTDPVQMSYTVVFFDQAIGFNVVARAEPSDWEKVREMTETWRGSFLQRQGQAVPNPNGDGEFVILEVSELKEAKAGAGLVSYFDFVTKTTSGGKITNSFTTAGHAIVDSILLSVQQGSETAEGNPNKLLEFLKTLKAAR
jgi:hypothetical protein